MSSRPPALQHFGFAAESMAAYVEVARGSQSYGGIGVNGKATVYPDGTTNGAHGRVGRHLRSPRRRDRRPAPRTQPGRASGSLNQRAPLVLPLGERGVLLQGAIGALRPPYELAYRALPQYTSVFDGWNAQHR